ncbi:MAG: DUF4367 domain-containing protein [Clostridia bacterium]|nr:DUF4367 domain-containing protein [Clostridia bacterium]
MNGKQTYTDDELMRAAGEILADERLAAFERYMDEEHRFSPRFERRRKKLFTKSGRGDRAAKPAATGRRWSVRTAAILAALAFLSVTAIAAGPIVDMIRTRTTAKRLDDGRFEVTVERNGDEDWIECGGEPTYLPEGYEEDIRSEIDDPRAPHLTILYQRKGGCYSEIEFERFIWESGTFGYGDEDGSEVETENVKIGPYEGIIQTVDWAGGGEYGKTAFIIWSDGKYLYELSAFVTAPPEDSILEYRLIPLAVEELLKVAESVTAEP